MKTHPLLQRIVMDPAIQHGKPVIKGTRVPIIRLLGGLAGGMTVEAVCHEYGVRPDDVRAALEYATDVIESEEVHSLPAS